MADTMYLGVPIVLLYIQADDFAAGTTLSMFATTFQPQWR
jgi:hypothetical protein